MTQEFDKQAIIAMENSFDFGELNVDDNCKPKNMIVKKVSVKFARPYIAKYHYSKTMPDSTTEVYAGFYGNKLAGIIVYGMGANHSQYSALFPEIKLGEYRELTRLWSPDGMPKNTESKLISESLKILSKEVRIIISFSDTGMNHQGYVYQATNFYYCGKTTPTKMLVDNNGKTRHPKSINMVRLRHPEYKNKTSSEIMEINKWSYIESKEKNRYVYILGSKPRKKYYYKFIKEKVLPYPKKQPIDNDRNT